MSYGRNQSDWEKAVITVLQRHGVEPTVGVVDGMLRVCSTSFMKGFTTAKRKAFTEGYKSGVKREQWEEACRKSRISAKEVEDEDAY